MNIMKRIRLMAIVMAAVAALPAYSQQNIRRFFDSMDKMSSVLVSEEHAKGDFVNGSPVWQTDVYYLKVAKDATPSAEDWIARFRGVFAKDRRFATREISRAGDVVMSNAKPVKVGSGDLEVLIGGVVKNSSYTVMIFPVDGDTTGIRRSVYAVEWLTIGDEWTEFKLVFDEGASPQKAKGNGGKDISKIDDWMTTFRMQCNTLRGVINNINKGDYVVTPSLIYTTCLECSLKDFNERKMYADELKKIVDRLNPSLDKSVLINAVRILEKGE